MNIQKIYPIFMNRFRPGRIRRLREKFPQIDGVGSILDAGGTLGWWQLVQPKNHDITVINLDQSHENSVCEAGYKFQAADARHLPFADSQFDLAFSNSVIEHVGSLGDQWLFARELLRCGKSVYVQTPYKWFPVEPHLIAPFIHWLPFSIERKMVRWFSVWGWVTKPDQQRIDDFLSEIRLLTRREMKMMFPDCKIKSEKFFGLTKSLIAMKDSADSHQ